MTREEQKRQRRHTILLCGLDLFVQKGFAATKISDIAAAADMSTGLLFHYFASKEALYRALVQMGLQGTKTPQQMAGPDTPALAYFEGFLQQLWAYTAENPWVAKMFVLMEEARRSDAAPADIRALAQQVDQISYSAEVLRRGQLDGSVRAGDPLALAFTFWACIQGVMEQLVRDSSAPLPEIDWLLDILRGSTAV